MDIYDKHAAAFRHVSAFVVLLAGERVATVAFKHGNAVTAFVHWFGLSMEFGIAKGGGYDRASAACSNAADKIKAQLRTLDAKDGADLKAKIDRLNDEGLGDFLDALDDRDGRHWDGRLRGAGFVVAQAV